MGSVYESHMTLVQELKDRGETVLQPRHGPPMGSIEGYIKTQVPHRDAGAIFKDTHGTYGLFGDFGVVHITGISWMT